MTTGPTRIGPRLMALTLGNLRERMEAEGKILKEGIPRILKQAAAFSKNARRSQLESSGLKGKILKTVRDDYVRLNGFDDYAVVYFNSKKYADLWTTGGAVSARRKTLLAIPIDPGMKRGPGGSIRRRLRDLRYDPKIKVVKRARGGYFVIRELRGRDRLLFVLVPQAVFKKRLDLEKADRATDELLERLLVDVVRDL